MEYIIVKRMNSNISMKSKTYLTIHLVIMVSGKVEEESEPNPAITTQSLMTTSAAVFKLPSTLFEARVYCQTAQVEYGVCPEN